MSESFAALFEESLQRTEMRPGEVITAEVVAVDQNFVIVDAGLKSEAYVPIEEFKNDQGEIEVQVGDFVSVAVGVIENGYGDTVLSRDTAKRLASWLSLEQALESGEFVTGTTSGRVKGGLTVLVNGIRAFLPGSLIDTRPVKDLTPYENKTLEFKVIKLDRKRNNVVLSRRAVVEATLGEERQKLMETLKEGAIVNGIVKNITDYGAFVDLGGVDGLLHVTDIAWKRINHPSEALTIGQQVKVQVVRFNPETQRISLGMKQLMSDPWDGAGAKYPVNLKLKGRVTNITDYGAFVELEPGVEGLVHVSEMSWTKKNVHPGKIVSTSQEVEVMVLDVDMSKRRISLGLKQCMANPWESFADQFPSGTELEGEVRNITEFGLFVGLPGDIDGMVHLSDLSWDKAGDEAIRDYKKGDQVKVKVLDVDMDKERISLGIKQLANDPFEKVGSVAKKGDVVTVIVAGIQDNGIDVTVQDGIPGFIRKSELSRDRSEQRPDRYAIGDKLDAKITNIDKASRRVVLSVKARELDEEKKAMADFGSSDSGASLGDILGAALKKKAEDDGK